MSVVKKIGNCHFSVFYWHDRKIRVKSNEWFERALTRNNLRTALRSGIKNKLELKKNAFNKFAITN